MLGAFVLLSFVGAFCSDVIGSPFWKGAAVLVLAGWLLPSALLPVCILGLFFALLGRR
ncbi:hypothetical protein [Sinimarinibacterium flocculans]|uniref:hypothetical protein n=1 Tax=Sinimarinibacterium flocculans TaxID=985250 RepID=UPI0035178B3B